MIHSMNGLLDHDVLAFANYCPLLENIYLDAFSAITVHSCSELLDKCSNLRTMHIRTNLKYTELNVEYWEKKCPSIYIRPFGLRSVIIYFRESIFFPLSCNSSCGTIKIKFKIILYNLQSIVSIGCRVCNKFFFFNKTPCHKR